jgi:hypothetical protein
LITLYVRITQPSHNGRKKWAGGSFEALPLGWCENKNNTTSPLDYCGTQTTPQAHSSRHDLRVDAGDRSRGEGARDLRVEPFVLDACFAAYTRGGGQRCMRSAACETGVTGGGRSGAAVAQRALARQQGEDRRSSLRRSFERP